MPSVVSIPSSGDMQQGRISFTVGFKKWTNKRSQPGAQKLQVDDIVSETIEHKVNIEQQS